MLIKYFDGKGVTVEGINCTASINKYNGGICAIEMKNFSDANFLGSKIDGLDNIYIASNLLNYDGLSGLIIGESETFFYVLDFSQLGLLRKMDKDKFNPSNMVTLEEIDTLQSFDTIVRLVDVPGTNKYKIVLEGGFGYENNGSVGNKVVEFDTLIDKSYKKFGFLWINANIQHTVRNQAIFTAHNEDEFGMKIDTTLDKEPIYFCDGTKDRLLLTEDMIVRGNTNFTNDEITINDKRILCEGNLEG